MKNLLALFLFTCSFTAAMQDGKFFSDVQRSQDAIINFMRATHWHDATKSELPEIEENFRKMWNVEDESKFMWSPRYHEQRKECIKTIIIKKLGEKSFDDYKLPKPSIYSGVIRRYAQVVVHKLNMLRPNLCQKVTEEELKLAESFVPSSPQELWFIKTGVKAKENDTIPKDYDRHELNRVLDVIKDALEA